MDLKIDKLGKKFSQEIIFKDISYTFYKGSKYAILGANGAGKSTLLKILSGALEPSRGSVSAIDNFTFVAPYIDLIEELTASEAYNFHFSFKKKSTRVIDKNHFFQMTSLINDQEKYIHSFSSGMKQRLKLGFAYATEAPLIILDEPTSNLDEKYCQWYKSLFSENFPESILLIGSNLMSEYEMCQHQLHLSYFK